MIEELQLLDDKILKNLNLHICNLHKEQECAKYLGFNFTIGAQNYKFRRAKITPKKFGQFVTLWKRNANGITEPFHYSDPFDFYIIATNHDDKKGLFVFPKKVFRDHEILTDLRVGKRGFRIYPEWDKLDSKQAIKTQNWQIPYFIDITEDTPMITKKFVTLINYNYQ